MHLLSTLPADGSDIEAAVDLGQSPGEIVLLSAADTDLACLAAAQAGLPPDSPSLRLANLLQLGHPLSVDLYVEQVVTHARLVVVRLLGGRGYWPYGLERIAAACAERGIPLACLPGDDRPDPELVELSTLAPEAVLHLGRYLSEGGLDNACEALRYAASLLGRDLAWREPEPLPRAGIYRRIRRGSDRPAAILVFYRALLQAGTLAPVDALIDALAQRGLNPLPIYVNSLKEAAAAELIAGLYAATGPAITLNCTGFAVSQPGAATFQTPFDAADAPVLQVVLGSGTLEQWRDGKTGLSPRDLAQRGEMVQHHRVLDPEGGYGFQCARDADFLVTGHRRTGALFAVAHRGIENDQTFGHDSLQIE